MMAPAVPLACRLSGPLVLEASCWEWYLGSFEEEPDWQLQEDKSPNWGQGFKKGARGKMKPAAGWRGRGRSDPGH